MVLTWRHQAYLLWFHRVSLPQAAQHLHQGHYQLTDLWWADIVARLCLILWLWTSKCYKASESFHSHKWKRKTGKHWWIIYTLLMMMVNIMTVAAYPVGSCTWKGERADEWNIGAAMAVIIFNLVFSNQSMTCRNLRTLVPIPESFWALQVIMYSRWGSEAQGKGSAGAHSIYYTLKLFCVHLPRIFKFKNCAV